MSRPTRTDSPGTWYHVMNRGVARRAFFEAEADAERFLRRVQEAVDRCGLEVHAYALVTNLLSDNYFCALTTTRSVHPISWG